MLIAYKLRVILVLFFSIITFAVIINTIINTNMMMSFYNTFNNDQVKLSKILRKEVQRVLDHYDEALSFKELQKVSISQSLMLRLNWIKKFFYEQRNDNLDSTTTSNLHGKPELINTVPYMFNKNFTPAYTLGKDVADDVSIVIGIPSVKRSAASYLLTTLQSIFQNVYPGNEPKITVVVMLAEADQLYVKNEARKIYASFTRQVTNGLLQVIAPDPSVYPDFDNLPQTLGDPQARLKWRSKEVFDAAYLMFYCRNKADYYLMLEDDIIASKGFVSAIMDFVAEHRKDNYVYLSFGNFNSIGKLFRKADIPVWVTYFLTFYGFKPIDWLMLDFAHVKYCNPEMSPTVCTAVKIRGRPQHHPAIFQHIGVLSSLDGKHQKLVDKEFALHAAANNSYRNPTAKVTSTLKGILSDVQPWYEDSGGMKKHYYVAPASANQCITIEFENVQTVSKILVKTGDLARKDRLFYKSAVLEILSKDLPYRDYENCATFDHNGEAECRFNRRTVSSMRIRILQDLESNTWFDLIYMD